MQISTLIRMAVQQTGSPSRAGSRMFTIGVEMLADAGVDEHQISERLFSIFRDRERRALGE